MKKYLSMILAVVMIASMMFIPATAAAGETVNETFSYDNGTMPTNGDWEVKTGPGTTAGVEDGRLKVTNNGTGGQIELSRNLSSAYDSTKLLVSYEMEIAKSTKYNLCFPHIVSRKGDTVGPTQILYANSARFLEQYKDEGDGSLKTREHGLPEFKEGVSYTFGFVIDLKTGKQDFYLKSSEGVVTKLEDKNFKTIGETKVEGITWWFGSENNGVPGEYYIDNLKFQEHTEAAYTEFMDIFYPQADASVDTMDAIKSKIGNDGVVLSVGSPLAFANNARKYVDPENVEVFPIIKAGRTLVPARFIAESLGTEVGWDDATQEVTIKGPGTDIALQIGSAAYTVNGQAFEFDVPAETINDRTMLPLRAIAEALGKEVSWKETGRDAGLIGIAGQANLFDGALAADLEKLITSYGFYVSPTGSDRAAGTKNAPFQTIERARDAVKAMKASGGIPEGGFYVYFLSGSYRIDKTIFFTEADSGSVQAPITYKAAAGEEVLFTGSATIPGANFTEVKSDSVRARMYPSAVDKIKQINLKDAGITDLGTVERANPFVNDRPDSATLYVNDVKQTLAKWPNDGYVMTGPVVSVTDNQMTFQYEETQANRWTRARDFWVGGYWAWDWADDTFLVSALDTNAKTISTVGKHTYGMSKGKRYYAFNLLEEIDMPGEWYLDRSTSVLYYYPTTNDLTNTKIQLATNKENLIALNNANYVNFADISVEASCFNAFAINNGGNNMLTGMTFRNLGGKAAMVNGANNVTISGCDIYSLAKGGVAFLDSGNFATLERGNNVVDNCYFSRYNLVCRTNTPAVAFNGVGVTVTNSVMHDAPHNALAGNGNEHWFENNELYDLCQESSDAGSFYTGRDWTGMGMKINNNAFHDTYGVNGSGAHMVYYDDEQNGGIVTNNLLYNGTSHSILIHGGREFLIDSNILANISEQAGISLINYSSGGPDRAIPQELADRYAAKPVQSAVWKAKYPRLAVIKEDEWWAPKYNVITNNLMYNAPQVMYVDSAVATGVFTGNTVTEDASIFADAANNNFRLVKDPGIPGFKGPDIDAIGLYLGQYRKSIPTISSFNLVSPSNAERNTLGYKLPLYWEPAIGAAQYKVTIATDKELTDVVFEKIVSATNMTIAENLEYGGKQYYWKVDAISLSMNNYAPKACNQVFSFVTAQNEIVDKTPLELQITEEKAFLDKAPIGDGKGEYTPEGAAAFEKAIADADVVLKSSGLTQMKVDNAVAALKQASNDFKGSLVVGNEDLGTLINDSANWVAANPNDMKREQDRIIYKPGAGGNIMGYKQIVPNYPVWTFKAKFDLSNGWTGLSMRAADPTSVAWSLANAYLIVIKPEQFELQRFYGAGSNKMWDVVPNNGIVTTGETYLVEMGAYDAAGGVQLVLKINGQVIFDELDTEPIPVAGVLSFYTGAGTTMELMSAGEDMPGYVAE